MISGSGTFEINLQMTQEANKADEIANELIQFENGAGSVPFRVKFDLAWDLLKNSNPIILQVISNQLVNTVGFLVIRFSGDLTTQSSFGFVVTFQSLGFLMMIKSVEELMGIKVSESFSSKRYQECKKYFMFGLMNLKLVLLFYTIPIYYFSGNILASLGIHAAVASQVSHICRSLIPAMIIQAINEFFKTFCNSQGIEKIFGIFNIGTILLFSPLYYYFAITQGKGVFGFVLYKYLINICTIVFTLYSYFKHTEKQTRGIDYSLVKTHKSELWVYLKKNFKFTLSFYVEVIGVEIGTLMAIYHEKLPDITAYMQFMNFVYTICGPAAGLGVIMRTRINFLIGKEEYKAAENFFWWAFRLLSSIGLLVGIGFIIIFRSWISGLYNGDGEAKGILMKILICYGCIYWSEIFLNSSMTAMRSLGKVAFLTYLNTFLTFGVNLTVCYVFGFWLGFGGVSYSLGLCISISLLGVTLLMILRGLNWEENAIKMREKMEEEGALVDVYELENLNDDYQ